MQSEEEEMCEENGDPGGGFDTAGEVNSRCIDSYVSGINAAHCTEVHGCVNRVVVSVVKLLSRKVERWFSQHSWSKAFPEGIFSLLQPDIPQVASSPVSETFVAARLPSQ